MKETLVWLLFAWSGNAYVPQPIYFSTEKACQSAIHYPVISFSTVGAYSPGPPSCHQAKVLFPRKP